MFLLLFCGQLKMENYWCPTSAPPTSLNKTLHTLSHTYTRTHTHIHTKHTEPPLTASRPLHRKWFYWVRYAQWRYHLVFIWLPQRGRLFIKFFIIKGAEKGIKMFEWEKGIINVWNKAVNMMQNVRCWASKNDFLNLKTPTTISLPLITCCDHLTRNGRGEGRRADVLPNMWHAVENCCFYFCVRWAECI